MGCRMIKVLKENHMLETTLLLSGMFLFCLCLSVMRVLVSGNHAYQFLAWNLFLAFVPWLLSTLLVVGKSGGVLMSAVLMLAWLLFFPNTPYILTDLIHLREGGGAPLWFDLILLLSYAMTGLYYGFVSLSNIEVILKRRLRKLPTKVVSVFLIYLSCFGIYLGRFLRWNSWDVFNNTVDVFSDVLERLAYPMSYLSTWAFTFLMGSLLNLVYLGYWYFNAGARGRKDSRIREKA
jgi:uncharacterized membrane protein